MYIICFHKNDWSKIKHMLIGYARISTVDQNLDMQKDALTKAGCEKIFTDVMSGSKDKRPGLESALNSLSTGDTLVVWKLDRLGRSVQQLIKCVQDLENKGITFLSIRDNLDTKTSAGKLFFHMQCSFAEFERSIISERTIAGLAAARARGRVGGPRHKLKEHEYKNMVEMYHENKKHSKSGRLPVEKISEIFGLNKVTLYKYVNKYSKPRKMMEIRNSIKESI